jgi:hypothetical protein
MEMKPIGGKRAPIGNEDPGQWTYYKLWRADLWKCPCCEHEIIHGTGFEPVWQDFHGGVEKLISEIGPGLKVLVCDC